MNHQEYAELAHTGNKTGKLIEKQGENYVLTSAPIVEEDYAEKRRQSYPDMRDFLDAQVKLSSSDENIKAEGQIQLNTYLSDCLAVKNQYPKN